MSKQLEERSQFNGRLTQKYREKLEQLKENGSFSYREMGMLIGCDTTTIRGWILGTKKRCQAHFVMVLRILFSGALDDMVISARMAKAPWLRDESDDE